MKASQIKAAKALGDMLSSLGTIEDDEHRINYAYNQVCEGVRNICDKHLVDGQPCFNEKQVECITHIAFQLFSILDAKIKPPPPPSSSLEAVYREYKSLPRLKRWKVYGSFLGGVLSIIGVVEGAKAGIGWIKEQTKPSAAQQNSTPGAAQTGSPPNTRNPK